MALTQDPVEVGKDTGDPEVTKNPAASMLPIVERGQGTGQTGAEVWTFDLTFHGFLLPLFFSSSLNHVFMDHVTSSCPHSQALLSNL